MTEHTPEPAKTLVERRELVAKIIDPEAWVNPDKSDAAYDRTPYRERSLAKADAILALTTGTPVDDEVMSVTLSKDGTVTSHNAYDADFDEMVRATETIISELQTRLSNRKFCPYSHGGALRTGELPETERDKNWFRRNSNRRDPKAYIRTNPDYFASECASAICNGSLVPMPEAGTPVDVISGGVREEPETQAWAWLDANYAMPTDQDYSADEMVDAFISGMAMPLPKPSPSPESEGVASGYKLVPAEPTEAMMAAAHDGPLMSSDYPMDGKQIEFLRDVWSTMLSAAPDPSSSFEEGER